MNLFAFTYIIDTSSNSSSEKYLDTILYPCMQIKTLNLKVDIIEGGVLLMILFLQTFNFFQVKTSGLKQRKFGK